jgi:hypothetical protein
MASLHSTRLVLGKLAYLKGGSKRYAAPERPIALLSHFPTS